MSEITNVEKYDNYRLHMQRLNRAIREHFWLEALFIQFAIIEDRCESILRHSGTFNSEKHDGLVKKLNRIRELQRNKSGLLHKYILILPPSVVPN